MTAVRRHSRRARAGGAALIAAVLIAAVIASIAVALTTRDQYSILGVTRLQESGVVTDLVRALEVQAATVLSLDLEASRHDGEEEPWFTTRYTAERGGYAAEAHLLDAQRQFNLNALAFQAPNAAEGGDDDVPPPNEEPVAADEASTTAARDALRGVVSGVPELAAPAAPAVGPDGSTQDATQELTAQQIAIARFQLLLQALDLPAELMPAILDWLDADSETRFPNGAEDEYYTRLEEPYRAANGRFVEVSELRLVRGMTPEFYAKLAPFVTVLDNAVPLNLNTAPAELLMSIGPGIDRATADLLVTSRKIQPLTSVSMWTHHPLLAGRPLLERGLATRSTFFTLYTRVQGDDLPTFRASLLERTAPNRLRVVRREKRYTDG